MFSFDPKSRILKVQKIPESELELNLLEYQRESYNKYVTETVYNDMQYLGGAPAHQDHRQRGRRGAGPVRGGPWLLRQVHQAPAHPAQEKAGAAVKPMM